MVGRARSRVSLRIHPSDIIYSRDALADRTIHHNGFLLVITYDAGCIGFCVFLKLSACVNESANPLETNRSLENHESVTS